MSRICELLSTTVYDKKGATMKAWIHTGITARCLESTLKKTVHNVPMKSDKEQKVLTEKIVFEIVANCTSVKLADA